MGVIFSRVRKKKSTVETLEKLENEIKEMEESRTNTQRKYKMITKLLLICSVGLYILCGLIFCFQFTSKVKGKFQYLWPLAVSLLLCYIIKKIISWYFIRVINKNQIRLNEMKNEKKRILEEVMDKETYKVAKQILDKFSSETGPKPNYTLQLAPIKQANDSLRKRIVNTSSSNTRTQFPSNIRKDFTERQACQPFTSNPVPSRPSPGPVTSMLRLPAPILPLHRNYLDRVVEYLIGDGPNNRYALICSQCHSHNGMALKEEFEYIGFKCCYCFFFNPARKLRPEAPRLENAPKVKQESSSDSERTSEENSDVEHNTAIGYVSTDVKENLESSDTKNSAESSTKKKYEAPKKIASNVTEPTKNYSQIMKESENLTKTGSVSNQLEVDADFDQLLEKS